LALAVECGSEMAGSNPKDWYMSYEPVPMSKWIVCQMLVGDSWKTLEPEFIETFRDDPYALAA
jgi:hypothetical protein